MWSRRRFVETVPIGIAVALLPVSVIAATGTKVLVPNSTVGAIVRAVAGELLVVETDETLAPTEFRLGSESVAIDDRIMLKGSGVGRARFLDDGRNASRVGANIRDALAKRIPEHASAFVANQGAWARPLTRDVLAWTRALAKSPLVGKRVRDDHGRAYLLEWAGAVVDPAGEPPPPALKSLPAHAETATPAAYHQYLATLVRAC